MDPLRNSFMDSYIFFLRAAFRKFFENLFKMLSRASSTTVFMDFIGISNKEYLIIFFWNSFRNSSRLFFKNFFRTSLRNFLHIHGFLLRFIHVIFQNFLYRFLWKLFQELHKKASIQSFFHGSLQKYD